MSGLEVVGFKGTHRAAEVLNQLLDLNESWTSGLSLRDAVAVYRTNNGRLRVDESYQITSGEGAASGGLLGALIGGLLAAPFTAGVSAAAAAAAVGTGAVTLGATGAAIGYADASEMKERYGISEEFVRQVGGMVQPGQSALFIMGDAFDPEDVANRFRGYGGTILYTTLPPVKAARVQQVIGTQGAPAR
ncbi:MAG TPA: DUF1269 domain-containing protein [Gemmatimonadaceae bacterium]|nr:DUF1269 domain-containing protein [Gemmatimonadaceae bacterium]